MPHELTRRGFLLGTMATAGAAFAMNRGIAADAVPSLIVDDLRVISWKPPLYHGWPTVAKRKNGELLLAFSGGRESHVCPWGRLELMRSKDGGETWGWPQVIYDSPIDDRDAGVLETPSGAILLTNFTSLAYADLLAQAPKKPQAWPELKLREWKAAHERLSEEQRQGELGNWMWRSNDGGVTWSARYRVPVNSPHGPFSLADGRLLYPGIDLWGKPRKVGVAHSTDDGRTWSWLADIPARLGDDLANYHELHGVEAANGTLIVHIRNHNTANAGETLQTESQDGGKTWSTPHPIGVWGLPSHLLRTSNGRLVMSYGYRKPPFGNQVRLSDDHGRTWSSPLTISGDGAGGDLGYPSTVELGNNRFLTVWYERLKDSPLAQIRQARWHLVMQPL